MSADSPSWYSKLAYFLFPAFEDVEQTQLQGRVATLSIYAVFLAAAVALPTNMARDAAAGSTTMVIAETVFGTLLLAGVFILLLWRRLRPVRLAIGAAVMSLTIGLIIDYGGPRGLGFVYLIAGYPIFYSILGFRGGLAIPIVVLVGFIVRPYFPGLHEGSILIDPEVYRSYLLVVAVSTMLGAFSVVYQRLIISSLYRAAFVDELTGLPNRRAVENSIDAMIQKAYADGAGFSVVGLKIMHFSRVNSYHGGAFADSVIKELGARLRSLDGARASRYTGTVFVMLSDETEFIPLERLGSAALDEAQRGFALDGRTASLEALVTVTRFPADGPSREALLSNVMAGFARMRDLTGLVSFYDEARHRSEMKRYDMVQELRQAIGRGELRLAYHPKSRLSDGAAYGAEVLLRWSSRRFGEVSPAVFIPLAEESDLILEITRWVVSTAFDDLRALDEAGCRVVHAINLSPKDLREEGFQAFIEAERERRGVEPSSVEFEITEGVMMDENPAMQRNLDFLRQAGFRLALDDFGTGYSSLSYLHRLRASNLKIDRSFITQLNESNPSSPVVDAIISMALSLGLEVTAEGVETSFQEAYLRGRLCTYGQGWLYSTPLPLNEYRAYLGNAGRCGDAG